MPSRLASPTVAGRESTIEPLTDRQRRLSNRTLLALGALSSLASLYVLRDFLLDILTAGFLAVLVYPARLYLRRHFGRHPALFSFLLTFAVLVLIVIPLALIVFMLFDQTKQALELVRENLGDNGLASLLHGRLPPALAALVTRINRYVPITTEQIRQDLLGLSGYLAPTLGGILSFSGRSLFATFVMLMALFYFFLHGERFVAWLEAILPLERRYTQELFREFRIVAQAMVQGSVITTLLCGIASTLAYWALGIPSPVVWGSLTGICQLAPALGSAVVWIPLSLVLVVTGHVASGVLASVFCTLVIGVGIDNLLRPYIVGRSITLHPLLIFVGVLGGVTSFGLSGLVVGPMVLALCTATLRIYRRDFAPTGEAPPAPAPAVALSAVAPAAELPAEGLTLRDARVAVAGPAARPVAEIVPSPE